MYICWGEGYSQREPSPLGMVDVSRERGRSWVCASDRLLSSSKNMLFRGLSRERSPCLAGAGAGVLGVEGVAGVGVSGGT